MNDEGGNHGDKVENMVSSVSDMAAEHPDADETSNISAIGLRAALINLEKGQVVNEDANRVAGRQTAGQKPNLDLLLRGEQMGRADAFRGIHHDMGKFNGIVRNQAV